MHCLRNKFLFSCHTGTNSSLMLYWDGSQEPNDLLDFWYAYDPKAASLARHIRTCTYELSLQAHLCYSLSLPNSAPERDRCSSWERLLKFCPIFVQQKSQGFRYGKNVRPSSGKKWTGQDILWKVNAFHLCQCFACRSARKPLWVQLHEGQVLSPAGKLERLSFPLYAKTRLHLTSRA